METLKRVVNQILNTSACNDDVEGYTCEECGTFIPAFVVELPIINKKKKVLPTCECVIKKDEEFVKNMQSYGRKKEFERLFSISNLGERFAEATFDSFLERNGSETAAKIARKYVNEFDSWKGESLMIWGEPGNGKTHIVSAITNELQKKGYIVVFQSVPELLRRIKSTFNSENKETEAQVMKALLTCDLLVLDDIGAEKATEWVEEKLYEIVDGRYRRTVPTLYTSNLQPKELHNQVGKRSYDRMVETSLIIENKATSYRREIAKKRLERLGDV